MTASAATTQTTDMDPKANAAAPALKFKVAKHVTLPLLKIAPEKPLYVKIVDAIFKAKPQAGSRAESAANKPEAEGSKKKQPPELAHCIDLTTGEHCQIIIGTVLGAELRETYPDNSYVGHSFQIIQHKVQGKDYATYSITEIEVEEEQKENAEVQKEQPTAKPTKK